jgi:hypothetical protein
MEVTMNAGDKVTHESHGNEVGIVRSVYYDGSFTTLWKDGEFEFPVAEFTVIEFATPKPPQKKTAPRGPDSLKYSVDYNRARRP